MTGSGTGGAGRSPGPEGRGHDLFALLDADGCIRATSASFVDAVGRGPHARPRASVFGAFHADDREVLRDALGRVAGGAGAAGPISCRLAAADGSWRRVAVTISRVSGDPVIDDAVLLSARHVSTDRRPGRERPPHRTFDVLAGALHEALDRDQFRLVYQPKVALSTNGIVGVEALLRWDHPVLGPVLPDEFIPVAEATGLIVPVGAWVLREACRQCASWQRSFEGTPPITVAVNASAEQFRAGLVGAVREAVDESGLAPTSLYLEVTESTVMHDVGAAIAILSELKALGLTVSIDDFGTGYSSLQYLRRLPLDEVKIDRSFVGGLGRDPEDTAIVAAVISLAHALDRDVVAEGVETLEQLYKLRSLGCELAQGYLFSPPAAPEVVTDLLAREEAGERLGGLDPGRSGAPSGTDTVVVADDAADIRQLARMSLTAAGFKVEEAADGAEAVALARRLQPACVVLDLSMPDTSGIEVCRLLRSDPATAGSAVVMLTTRDEAAAKAAAFSAGADDYIVKPFAPRDLVSRVRGVLGRRRAGGTA